MINKQESNIIRYLRSISMIGIVLCHILQSYNNKWAWIFNVGVQVFLVISGWLYGNKNITNWKHWYINKLKKLYIPYLAYVFIIFIIYNTINLNFPYKYLFFYIFDLQWIFGNVKGISHLWFMTAIGICYTLTPFLQYIKNKGNVSWGLFLLSIIGVLNFLIFKIYLSIFSPIFIYMYTYLFVCQNSRQQKIYLTSNVLIFIYTLYSFNWINIMEYTNYLNVLFHASLGLICVLIPISIANNIKPIKVLPIVKWFDKYSYLIYITHHIFILGPLSIAFFTDSIPCNVLIILLLTCISSLILKILSENIIFIFKQIK